MGTALILPKEKKGAELELFEPSGQAPPTQIFSMLWSEEKYYKPEEKSSLVESEKWCVTKADFKRLIFRRVNGSYEDWVNGDVLLRIITKAAWQVPGEKIYRTFRPSRKLDRIPEQNTLQQF